MTKQQIQFRDQRITELRRQGMTESQISERVGYPIKAVRRVLLRLRKAGLVGYVK